MLQGGGCTLKKTKMQKTVKQKDDGRYIIFYTFTKKKEK